VGDYVLRDRLGKGTMGTVYRVRHKNTGAQFALKALPVSASKYLVKRFQREGEAQAAVDAHPNVCRIRSAGTDKGHHFLVMDLAMGGDLDHRLRRGPMPPREAAELLLQLANGLAHVHARGVLHRDLKPANVLFDAEGTPKLVDFGLALHGEKSGDLTKTGDLLGTPIYMAPEQARGKHKDVDERSDVYGLGAILYHALTGQRPFTGATSMEVVQQVIRSEPPPPRLLEPAVPQALDAICRQAMAKEPRARIPTAKALAEELQRFLAGEPTTAAPPPPPPRQLPVPLLVGAGLGVFLGVAGVLVAVTRDGGAAEGAAAERSAQPTPAAAAGADASSKAPRAPKATAPRWALRVGAVARATLVHEVETHPPAGQEARWKGRFHSLFRSRWSFKVIHAGGQKGTIQATLDGLQVRRSSMFGNLDYDSERDGSDSPFSRALGERLELDLDPRSGRVLAVREANSLQAAIDQAVVERGFRVRRTMFEVPHFRSPVRLQNLLNQVLFVLPEERGWAGEAYERLEAIEDPPRPPNRTPREWDMGHALGLPGAHEALVQRFELRRSGAGHEVLWAGRTDRRSVEGSGRWEGGRLKQARLRETQERANVRGPGSRLIETKVEFEVRGRLD
jgi:hypothetical protein